MNPSKNNILTYLCAGLAVLFTACSKDPAPVSTTATSQPSAPAKPAAAEAPAANATTCTHGAPKEWCFICDPALRDPNRLWCREHARYEDRCWLCHPELQNKERLYCDEHGMYEDECFICHPEVKNKKASVPPTPGAQTGAVATQTAAPDALWCKEHNVAEAECGICHPELFATDQGSRSLKVRFPSEDSASKAGLSTAKPRSAPVSDGISAYAELTFDQNRLAQITTLASGIVQAVHIDVGQRVTKGTLLARVASIQIGEAQSAYLSALAQARLKDKALERERSLRAQRISPEKDLQEAEAAYETAAAAVEAARLQLLTLGFNQEQIDMIARREFDTGIFELRAPFDGEIVERYAVQGALAEIGKPLFTLADTSLLWAMVNIPENELSKVEVGQKVELRVASFPTETFTGELTWISPQVDERTRMARARVEAPNTGRRLKAQMFARARILTSDRSDAVVVPHSAVQQLEGKPMVFVQLEPDLFEVRPVVLGTRLRDSVEITSGVGTEDHVVVSSAFTAKTQFLLSRLGAGCVH